MSTHECQWTLRRAHECWWVIQSAQVLDPVLNQKWQLFKRVPCSILTISWSRFNQIIKSRIFLKSTSKGLLKNVSDGISRPIKGCLPSKVVFHQRSSSMEGCLSSKVVFHWRSSSIKGCLPSKVVFHKRPSSIKGHLPSMVVFHWRLSSNHQMSSTIGPKGAVCILAPNFTWVR